MFWNKWFKKVRLKEGKFDSNIAEIKAVNINDLKSAFSSDMSIFQVHSYCITVDEYILLLKKLIESFHSNTLLYNSQLPRELFLVSISNFYLDNKGRYTDVNIKTEELFNNIIELLTIYDEKERSLDKSFEVEKNLLLTQHIVANILTLYREIINGRLQRNDSSVSRRNQNRYVR